MKITTPNIKQVNIITPSGKPMMITTPNRVVTSEVRAPKLLSTNNSIVPSTVTPVNSIKFIGNPTEKEEDTINSVADLARIPSLALWGNDWAQKAWHNSTKDLDSIINTAKSLVSINSLNETLDMIANPVKGLVLEEDHGQGFVKGLTGQKNYNYDTGNFVTDLLAEVASDPVNWVTLGAGAIKTAGAKTVASSADDVVRAAGKKLASETISEAEEALLEQSSKALLAKNLAKTDSIDDALELIANRFSKVYKITDANKELFKVEVKEAITKQVGYKTLRIAQKVGAAANTVDNVLLRATTGPFTLGYTWLPKGTRTFLKEGTQTALHKFTGIANKIINRPKMPFEISIPAFANGDTINLKQTENAIFRTTDISVTEKTNLFNVDKQMENIIDSVALKPNDHIFESVPDLLSTKSEQEFIEYMNDAFQSKVCVTFAREGNNVKIVPIKIFGSRSIQEALNSAAYIITKPDYLSLVKASRLPISDNALIGAYRSFVQKFKTFALERYATAIRNLGDIIVKTSMQLENVVDTLVYGYNALKTLDDYTVLVTKFIENVMFKNNYFDELVDNSGVIDINRLLNAIINNKYEKGIGPEKLLNYLSASEIKNLNLKQFKFTTAEDLDAHLRMWSDFMLVGTGADDVLGSNIANLYNKSRNIDRALFGNNEGFAGHNDIYNLNVKFFDDPTYAKLSKEDIIKQNHLDIETVGNKTAKDLAKEYVTPINPRAILNKSIFKYHPEVLYANTNTFSNYYIQQFALNPRMFELSKTEFMETFLEANPNADQFLVDLSQLYLSVKHIDQAMNLSIGDMLRVLEIDDTLLKGDTFKSLDTQTQELILKRLNMDRYLKEQILDTKEQIDKLLSDELSNLDKQDLLAIKKDLDTLLTDKQQIKNYLEKYIYTENNTALSTTMDLSVLNVDFNNPKLVAENKLINAFNIYQDREQFNALKNITQGDIEKTINDLYSNDFNYDYYIQRYENTQDMLKQYTQAMKEAVMSIDTDVYAVKPNSAVYQEIMIKLQDPDYILTGEEMQYLTDIISDVGYYKNTEVWEKVKGLSGYNDIRDRILKNDADKIVHGKTYITDLDKYNAAIKNKTGDEWRYTIKVNDARNPLAVNYEASSALNQEYRTLLQRNQELKGNMNRVSQDINYAYEQLRTLKAEVLTNKKEKLDAARKAVLDKYETPEYQWLQRQWETRDITYHESNIDTIETKVKRAKIDTIISKLEDVKKVLTNDYENDLGGYLKNWLPPEKMNDPSKYRMTNSYQTHIKSLDKQIRNLRAKQKAGEKYITNYDIKIYEPNLLRDNPVNSFPTSIHKSAIQNQKNYIDSQVKYYLSPKRKTGVAGYDINGARKPRTKADTPNFFGQEPADFEYKDAVHFMLDEMKNNTLTKHINNYSRENILKQFNIDDAGKYILNDSQAKQYYAWVGIDFTRCAKQKNIAEIKERLLSGKAYKGSKKDIDAYLETGDISTKLQQYLKDEAEKFNKYIYGAQARAELTAAQLEAQESTNALFNLGFYKRENLKGEFVLPSDESYFDYDFTPETKAYTDFKKKLNAEGLTEEEIEAVVHNKYHVGDSDIENAFVKRFKYNDLSEGTSLQEFIDNLDPDVLNNAETNVHESHKLLTNRALNYKYLNIYDERKAKFYSEVAELKTVRDQAQAEYDAYLNLFDVNYNRTPKIMRDADEKALAYMEENPLYKAKYERYHDHPDSERVQAFLKAVEDIQNSDEAQIFYVTEVQPLIEHINDLQSARKYMYTNMKVPLREKLSTYGYRPYLYKALDEESADLTLGYLDKDNEWIEGFNQDTISNILYDDKQLLYQLANDEKNKAKGLQTMQQIAYDAYTREANDTLDTLKYAYLDNNNELRTQSRGLSDILPSSWVLDSEGNLIKTNPIKEQLDMLNLTRPVDNQIDTEQIYAFGNIYRSIIKNIDNEYNSAFMDTIFNNMSGIQQIKSTDTIKTLESLLATGDYKILTSDPYAKKAYKILTEGARSDIESVLYQSVMGDPTKQIYLNSFKDIAQKYAEDINLSQKEFNNTWEEFLTKVKQGNGNVSTLDLLDMVEQKGKDTRYFGLGKSNAKLADALDKAIADTKDKINVFRESKYYKYTPLGMFSTFERFGRGGQYTALIEQGYKSYEALSAVINTHFDYAAKPELIAKLELFIPFLTFPIENLKYWAREIDRHPMYVLNMLRLREVNYQMYDRSDYELQNNRALQYNYNVGNIMLGEHDKGESNLVLKLNPSLYDALGLVTDPIGSLADRTIIPKGLSTRDMLSVLPGGSTLYDIGKIPSNVTNKGASLNTLWPSMFGSVYNYNDPKKYTPYGYRTGYYYDKETNSWKPLYRRGTNKRVRYRNIYPRYRYQVPNNKFRPRVKISNKPKINTMYNPLYRVIFK